MPGPAPPLPLNTLIISEIPDLLLGPIEIVGRSGCTITLGWVLWYISLVCVVELRFRVVWSS